MLRIGTIFLSAPTPFNASVATTINGDMPATSANKGQPANGTATPVNRVNGTVNGHNRVRSAVKRATVPS
jgi:hypothetical protein